MNTAELRRAMERYEPKAIEEKWQRIWADAHAFEVSNPEPSKDDGAAKSYVLVPKI